MNKTVHASFRCYLPDGDPCKHWQELPFDNIPYWVSCYYYTHPKCTGISVQIIFKPEVPKS